MSAMTEPTLTEFLLARIAEDEAAARDLLRDLETQIVESGFRVDERGPVTPTRQLAAEMWAHYRGQTRWRNVARGQHIARLSDPARVLAECEAKRRIVEFAEEATCLDAQVDNERRLGARDMQTEPYLGNSILAALALPYADHMDFREEWRV